MIQFPILGQRVQLAGADIQISKASPIDPELRIFDNQADENLSPLAIFFKSYFESSNLTDYQSLFLSGDWIGIDQERFDSWRTYLSENLITADGEFEFVSDGVQFGLVAYSLKTPSKAVRKFFLAKRVNDKWYPTTHSDRSDLDKAPMLLSLFRPQMINQLSDNLDELESFYQDQGAITVERSPQNQLFYHPVVHNEKVINRRNERLPEFDAYLEQIKFDQNFKEQFLELFRRAQYAKAVQLITDHSDENYMRKVADKLNEILEEELL